jgi:hypothetical protein
MSSRPDISSVCSIISRIAAGFDISAGEKDTRTLKSEATLARTSAISSGLPKPLRTISEPASAKALAMPSPIPLVDREAMFSGLMAMFRVCPPIRDGRRGSLGANLPEASRAPPMPIG